MQLTAIVRKGEKQYVTLCPEVDVVSQGYTVEESLHNLKEAVEYTSRRFLGSNELNGNAFLAHFLVVAKPVPAEIHF